MPEYLPHCLPFLYDSYALRPAQRLPLVPLLPTFFSRTLGEVKVTGIHGCSCKVEYI